MNEYGQSKFKKLFPDCPSQWVYQFTFLPVVLESTISPSISDTVHHLKDTVESNIASPDGVL